MLLAVGLAGCGVPTGGKPIALPARKVPYILENNGTVREATVVPLKRGQANFVIYLLNNGMLVAVGRKIAQPNPQSALDALTSGPTDQELITGMNTALDTSPPPKLKVTTSNNVPGTASVALDTSTAVAVEPTALYQELGQIVWTLTQFCSIDEVRFTYGGLPFPAYLPNGTAAKSPVSRVDYLELAPSTTGKEQVKCISSTVPTTRTTTTRIGHSARSMELRGHSLNKS